MDDVELGDSLDFGKKKKKKSKSKEATEGADGEGAEEEAEADDDLNLVRLAGRNPRLSSLNAEHALSAPPLSADAGQEKEEEEVQGAY